jgi:hypothetical membrane protein
VDGVRWWGVASSAVAPVALIGGWTLAAARQPDFDSVSESISALAGRGATERWLMTCALLTVGACHVTTAAALRPVAGAGRFLLAAGGVATVGVAAFPLPAAGGSAPHAVSAAVAFGALATWPAVAGALSRYGLTPAIGRGTAAGLLALVAWFAAELTADGTHLGLSERIAAGAQALCPLAITLVLRRRPRR